MTHPSRCTPQSTSFVNRINQLSEKYPKSSLHCILFCVAVVIAVCTILCVFQSLSNFGFEGPTYLFSSHQVNIVLEQFLNLKLRLRTHCAYKCGFQQAHCFFILELLQIQHFIHYFSEENILEFIWCT